MFEFICGDLIESAEAFLNLSSITVDGVQYVPALDGVVAITHLCLGVLDRIRIHVATFFLYLVLLFCGVHFLIRYIKSVRERNKSEEVK